jgi:thymidylate kinase
VVRCAALGLEPDLEAMLCAPMPRGAPETASIDRRARLIAITGIDGSGKSSQVGSLAEELRTSGAQVEVVKLYRQGAFLELANQLGARTRRGGPLAAFVTSRVVKLVDSLRVYRDQLARALVEADAVICDRYVETHLAAAESQLGWDLTGHPALAPFPPADVRFWLALDPELALRRRDERGEPPSADEHALGLAGYASVFARIAARGAQGDGDGGDAREVVLDATAPASENRRAIRERVAPLLCAPHGDPAKSSLVASRGTARRPARRCAVHIGGAPGAIERSGNEPGAADSDAVAPLVVELGAEVPALRAALDGWCGPIAGRAPEGFWLEAYAAQIVLDLWTLDAPRARIALWPGAVVGMASHGSLEMLRELARMLAPLVEIESYDPRPASYVAAFVALGAAPRAALRLARDYAAQLEGLAGEGGWEAGS